MHWRQHVRLISINETIKDLKYVLRNFPKLNSVYAPRPITSYKCLNNFTDIFIYPKQDIKKKKKKNRLGTYEFEIK